ncbi:acyltransferase family protein [Nocardiopsis kunsanensis]|uniref:acyltransferase family protein n=1 Tax=Nocardiopsis kunsanensis TaxID=141693 RepID=UPI0009FC165A|nr:acyltransferase family protein [Nocardiopsis kunsanensis]
MTSPVSPQPDPGHGVSRVPDSADRPEQSAQVPNRDSRLDNAKFVLIALVVFGHAIEPLRDYPPTQVLYYWIYLFHMPAFILISGYLSRNFDASPNRVEKAVLTLAVPYLIFWAIHQTIYAVDEGLPDSLSVLTPTWSLWFLVALFLWRLSVPVWKRLRWPVTIAVIISAFAATADLGTTLSLGRVLSFLPFFVLGLALRKEHLALLDRVWARVGAVAVFATTFAFALFIANEEVSREWLFWRESLTDRDIDPLLPSMAIRLIFMGIALAMSFAVLTLTPKKRTWFTKLGAYTLFVYLGHSVVLLVLKTSPYYDFFEGTGPIGLAVTTTLAVSLVLLLCSPWVRKAMKWAVEPQPTWFLRRNDQQPAPAAAMSGSSPSDDSPASEVPAAPGTASGENRGSGPDSGEGKGPEQRPGSS